MQKSAALFFYLFLLLPEGGPLLKNIFFMVKLNENCVFEVFFLATWAEAQSCKQLFFFNYFHCFRGLSANNENIQQMKKSAARFF